ncbi:hypothetical protein, partial [Pseudomonas fluorescens]|uniref:hypothetical protein n=1 Tax=Pseudomonas fluorescens TaxID=294 RepID=UPI0017875C8C
MGAARAEAQAAQYSHQRPEFVSEATGNDRSGTCRVRTIASYTAAILNRTVLTNGAGFNRHPSLTDVFAEYPTLTGFDFNAVRATRSCGARAFKRDGSPRLADASPLICDDTPVLGSALNQRSNIHGRASKVLSHT